MEAFLLEFEGGALLPSVSVAIRYPVHRLDCGFGVFCAIESFLTCKKRLGMNRVFFSSGGRT